MKSIKHWDVVAPKDKWERQYAVIEYTRLGLLRTFSRKIKIS